MKKILLFTCFAALTLCLQVDMMAQTNLEVESNDIDVADFSSTTSTTRLNLNSLNALINGSYKRAFIETDVSTFRLATSSNNTGGSIRFATWAGGSQLDRLTILANGNVGIGISPLYKLHVLANNSVPLYLETTIDDNYISYKNGSGYQGYSGVYTAAPFTNQDMQFGTGGGNTSGKTYLVCNANPKLSVDVSGNVEINESYILPNADGSAGEVLTTDGAGNVNWSAGGSPDQVAFSAYLMDDITISHGQTVDMDNYTEQFDLGNDFNAATGEFTAPSDGIYSFTFKAPIKKEIGTGASGIFQIEMGSNNRSDDVVDLSSVSYFTYEHTILEQLTSGQTITVRCYQYFGSGNDIVVEGDALGTSFRAFFTGYKVY